MRPGYVCIRTLLTASLVLAVACSGSGGRDQYKGKDAETEFDCPTTGTGAVVCIDAATQTDSSTTTGVDAGGDAADDATGGQ